MTVLQIYKHLATGRQGVRPESCVALPGRALQAGAATGASKQPGKLCGTSIHATRPACLAPRLPTHHGAWVCRSSQKSEQLLLEPSTAPTASQPAAGPDLVLECPDTGASIHVFGVSHLEPQPHIGEWILRRRPAAVVVETALGGEHGGSAGNVVRCGDRLGDPTANFFLRMFCQIGTSLREYTEGDFTASPLWGQVSRSYNGEQLAYIGALATGVPLVFGDRPKHITYSRLFSLPSLAQLDAGFSHVAEHNYRAVMRQQQQENLPYDRQQEGDQDPQQQLHQLPYDPDSLPLTEQIMMLEREAVMLGVVQRVCSGALPQLQQQGGERQQQGGQGGQQEQAGQGQAGGGTRSIALVVGSAHLQGLQYLWQTGRWRQLLLSGTLSGTQPSPSSSSSSPSSSCSSSFPPSPSPAAPLDPLSGSPLLAPPAPPHCAASDPQYGLRRGLLEALLRLSVTKEVLSDLTAVLGPVPPQHEESYSGVGEVYGAPRMQLASLPRELLGRLVAGRECDFYEVLQPMRDIRPMYGGPGYSEDMVSYVRGLNFELD